MTVAHVIKVKMAMSHILATIFSPGSAQQTAKAFDYMRQHKLPQMPLAALKTFSVSAFQSETIWIAYLADLGINSKRHIKITIEGVLMGALLQYSALEHIAIISDGARPFDALEHGLCWAHTKRLIHVMVPLNDSHRVDIDKIRSPIWALYKGLKSYKLAPDKEYAVKLSAEFDNIFGTTTRYELLNRCLKRLSKLKDKLLLVLKRPEVPLHTNGSEGDIRDYVKKRKVSGGTRSELDRQCRDTFISLKKNCRKLGVSFWKYLYDCHYSRLITP
jgi:hypothetical protein